MYNYRCKSCLCKPTSNKFIFFGFIAVPRNEFGKKSTVTIILILLLANL